MNYDTHFRRGNLKRYLLQCALAGGVVLILLIVLDAVTQTVLIAALGASTFIAFAVPLSLQSSPRHMIGGYVAGIFAGCLMSVIHRWMDITDVAFDHTVMIIFAAFATALAMFTMVATRTEHPPAAALALGLVLNEWNLLTLAVVLGGIIGLSIFKKLILPYLMELV